jgi:hypothetical protein
MSSAGLPMPIPLTQDELRRTVLTGSHALQPGFTPLSWPACEGNDFMDINRLYSLLPEEMALVVQPEWLAQRCCWFAFRFPGNVVLAGCLYGRQTSWQVTDGPAAGEFMSWTDDALLGPQGVVAGDLFEAVYQHWTGEAMPLSAYDGHPEALARRLQREAAALGAVLPTGTPNKPALRL